MNYSKICDAAKILANTLYNLASSSKQSENVPVNCEKVFLLLECFTKDSRVCGRTGISWSSSSSSIPSHYPGVFDWLSLISPTSSYVYGFMARLTRTDGAVKPSSCSAQEDCKVAGQSCVLSECIITSTFYHDAYSLAFEYDYSASKWKMATVSGNAFSNFSESTFTESLLVEKANSSSC